MDPYSILGARPSASPEELRTCYKKAALASHPDKNPGDPTAATRFRAVHAAWLKLSNEPRRAAYDASNARAPDFGGRTATRQKAQWRWAAPNPTGEWRRTANTRRLDASDEESSDADTSDAEEDAATLQDETIPPWEEVVRAWTERVLVSSIGAGSAGGHRGMTLQVVSTLASKFATMILLLAILYGCRFLGSRPP